MPQEKSNPSDNVVRARNKFHESGERVSNAIDEVRNSINNLTATEGFIDGLTPKQRQFYTKFATTMGNYLIALSISWHDESANPYSLLKEMESAKRRGA